ncbi:MAG: hypothetical protein Kow0027_23790 [Saprospiraceae bacterium]
MNKLYKTMLRSLCLAILTFSFSQVPAQIIFDNFDSYDVGSTTGTNAAHWSTWSGNVGGMEDGVVIDDQAFSAPNSMLIAEGEIQDVLLLLGNKSSGRYLLRWMCYVQGGSSAYYNIQESEAPGVAWNLDVFYGADVQGNPSAGGTGVVAQTGTTFTYPEDAWFMVSHDIDLDNNELKLYIDGTLVEQMPYNGNLGAVDFYSINQQNHYYIDDVLFTNTPALVTFRVDLGEMTPDPAGVFFAGNINSWSDEAMTNSSGSVWELTKVIDAGTEVVFKYKNGPNGWETSVVPDGDLAPCGADDGYGNYNRYLNVLGDLDMDPVCIGYCLTCDMVNSVEDAQLAEAVSISPNPASDFINLEYGFEQGTDLSVRVLNSLGQVMVQKNLTGVLAGTEQIAISSLPGGAYFVLLSNGKGTFAQKLIVR